MTQLSTEDVVRNIHESNDAAPTGNLKYSTKESIIEDIRMRAEDGIIEPSNAELLIKLINNADDLNEAISIAALGTMYKRTGLYFDVRLEKQDSHTIHYLKKNKKYSFYDSENPNLNHLIIGDNYHALQNLMVMHPEPFVDVIYIDPPYGKDSMGQFAKTNYKNGITRDNLLSQLYPRLLLARQLLKEDGTILISIDDRNVAYITSLMNEIFGEQCFLFIAPRITKKGGKSTDTIQKNHDYIIGYSLNKDIVFAQEEKDISSFKLEDEFVAERGPYKLTQTLDYNSLQYSTNMDYPIEIDGQIFVPGGDVNLYNQRHAGLHGETDWVWRWSKGAVQWGLQNGFVVVKGNRIYTKTYLNCRKKNSKNEIEYIAGTKSYTTLSFLENLYSNDNGKKELDGIFIDSNKLFKNPKPSALIKSLIRMVCNNEDAVVLDFYAGSGTTGQAVLELNKEDGGNRTFILCTNNEPEDGYIADNVTTKRLKRVMTGCCYDGTSNFPWAQKNQPLGGSLEVYDICSVANFEMTEGKTPFDVIDETAYGKKKMELQDKIKWVCENFEQTQPILAEKDKEATS